MTTEAGDKPEEAFKNIIDHTDEELLEIANTLWDELIEYSNKGEYCNFVKKFSYDLLLGLNEVEIGKQFAKMIGAEKVLVQKSGYYSRAAPSNVDDLVLIKRCVAKAVEALEAGRIGRILLTRPAIEAGEKSIPTHVQPAAASRCV